MQRSDIKPHNYRELLNRILPTIMSNGLKSTTMDSVAASLGMSKRTLYEIFGSKSEMIREALCELERQSHEYYTEVFAKAGNVMEAIIAIFKYNRDFVGSVNVEFYRDMDTLYKDKREEYDRVREKRYEKLSNLFKLGVEQGMFRPDADYDVQTRMMGLQMEGLKRIEELFPPDISLQRVFDAIIISFLRSIASEKGMRVLDNEIGKSKKGIKETRQE